MEKRGQISVEYLIIVGSITFLLIGILAVSYFYIGQVKSTTDANQVDQIVKRIISNAELVSFHGVPSKISFKIQFPEGIQSINYSAGELSITFRSSGRNIDLHYPTAITLQGNLSTTAGIKEVVLEAKEGYVWVGQI
jgi:hypothetical protein